MMRLKKNDTVIIFSPAGRVLNANIDNAVRTLESWGLEVLVSRNAKNEYYNFSGTEEERLSDLQWALDHPEAKAIFAARGGYGAIHLLDKLDWTVFVQQPKLLIGYSDITNFHAVVNNLGFPSLHALMPNSFPMADETNASLDSLKQVLLAQDYTVSFRCSDSVPDCCIEGEIVGGNLSILYSLQGTPYAPLYDDKILFIEEVGEYLYHIDRMVHSLAMGGVFAKIKALVVGDFTDIKDNENFFGKTVEQIIQTVVKPYGIPVIFGLKTGHGAPTLALPLGCRTTLEVQKNICRMGF